MIIALAGHVDHGKTSLVHALSGVNTDRLEEEKRRGLTIDLGFAYIDEGRVGFVDVPGHHKFIHNMVAGIASDQTAMLVIAADDGPMLQSKEHLDILGLLGVNQGMVVMTKTDRVTDERRVACEEEIRALVENTFLAASPIFQTSIESTDSFAALKAHINQLAAENDPTHDGLFRLAIDRRFTVKGSGVVVTGTIHNGTVKVDDSLFHFPSGSSVRVRGLRAQDKNVDTASQGERCAINLSGLDLDDLDRGDWLSLVPTRPYQEVTIDLRVLGEFPRAIKQWTPVHIYHATSHARGHIALLDGNRLQPGQQAAVDLILDTPLAVQSGDQIIIRDHGLDTTLGGGKVIYANVEPTPRRRNHERLETVKAFATGDAQSTLIELLDAQQTPNLTGFKAFWQLDDARLDQLLTVGQALKLNDHIIAKTRLGALAKATLDEVTNHQKENPDSPGLKENDIAGVPQIFRTQVLGALVKTGKLKLTGGIYSAVGHTAALPPDLALRYDALKPKLDSPQPPSTGDLAKAWNMPLKDLEVQMRELGRRGLLVYIADHRYYLPIQLQAIVGIVQQMARAAPFTVREFRDKTGIGRNVAIDILEYFDSKGFTRRQENHRVLLRDTL